MQTAFEGDAELARRAAAGEAEAQFAYGRQILNDPNASEEGLRAIELVEAASQQGHAEAMALTAVFEAMGAARPQSWPRAFDRLQQAAAAGSAQARGQLIALADGETSDVVQPEGADVWAAYRAGISEEKLLQAPPRQLLFDNPRIAAFSAFATAAECNWLIARARDRLRPAAVFHTSTGEQAQNPVRDNSAIEFQLAHMDLVVEVIRARISSATGLPVQIFEPTQVLHYAVGEQFRPHCDFLDPNAPGFAEQLSLYGQRIATVLVYLNDGYTGGETVFPRLGINYRGGAGDALFFANVDRSGRVAPVTLHAGTPPKSGEKWIISQWIRDRVPGHGALAGASAG